jgi:tetrahydromethanopterin S-methyltransferase subunit B
MSRWVEQFESHPFQAVWANLKESLNEAKVDDETVVTAVQELARLKKVIAFVDEMIHSLDPELVPLSTWDNFNNQATPCYQQIISFNSNRSFGHITTANTHADNLITYVRPYMIVEGKAGKVLQESSKQYAKTIDEYLEGFQAKAAELLTEIHGNSVDATNLRNDTYTAYEAADKYSMKLLGDGDNPDSIKSRVDDLVKSISDYYDQINEFHDETLVDTAVGPSTKKLITQAKEDVAAKQVAITELLESVTQEVEDLESFHTKIYGVPNKLGELEGGLLKDFDARVAKLGDFEIKQIDKYNALNIEIENLLPGATSAGLATAYLEMKNSFDKPIKIFENVFYGAVALLILTALFSVFDSVGLFWIKFAEFKTWDAALKALMNKLPLYGALIWLAFFASKRRSENQRLQQE